MRDSLKKSEWWADRYPSRPPPLCQVHKDEEPGNEPKEIGLVILNDF